MTKKQIAETQESYNRFMSAEIARSQARRADQTKRREDQTTIIGHVPPGTVITRDLINAMLDSYQRGEKPGVWIDVVKDNQEP